MGRRPESEATLEETHGGRPGRDQGAGAESSPGRPCPPRRGLEVNQEIAEARGGGTSRGLRT